MSANQPKEKIRPGRTNRLKRSAVQFTTLCLCLLVFRAAATTYYADINSTNPTPPYTNWSVASTDIQSAINEASNGDFILVNPGIYRTGLFHFIDRSNQNAQVQSRIGIPSGVSVLSAAGPGVTVIQGGANFSCATLIGNAMLSGFTLTNGSPPPTSPSLGGGAYCQSTSGVISNCLICSNSVVGDGGGVFQGTLNNCILSNNWAMYRGGGSFGSVLNHCILVGNTVLQSVPVGGAGAAAYGGSLNCCIVISNAVLGGSESNGGAVCSNALNNCLILFNLGTFDQASAAVDSALTNCTIVGNLNTSADMTPVVQTCVLRNCILYYNGYYEPSDYTYGGSDLKNCCAEPDWDFHGGSNGVFTNAPSFINTNGNFRLQSSSPCINSGNNSYAQTTTDLDGNPRIVAGTVDIGAYEYQTPVSEIPYAWLDQYGLPIVAGIDTSDLDGTGFTVYQDWIAGLDPTNSASILAMLTTITTNSTTGIKVTWQSVSGIPYFLQRSTNLVSQPAFATIQSNITGQANTTSYTDITATNNIPYFYRVGVIAP